MDFERVAGRVEIMSGNAVLDPAPPALTPECRPVDALLAVAASGSLRPTPPTTVLFGLYTALPHHVPTPAYVFVWRDVVARGSGPARPQPRSLSRATEFVVVRTADRVVLGLITVGTGR